MPASKRPSAAPAKPKCGWPWSAAHGKPAKGGRQLCRYNLPFHANWAGKHYAIKQVAPVIKEEPNETIVITVYTFYF